MSESNIENKKVFTNKQVAWMLAGTVSVVFTLSTIYSKFIFNDQQLQINKAKIQEVELKHDAEIRELRATMYKFVNGKMDDVNGRIERKSDRLSKSVKDNNEEIEQLQKDVLIIKSHEKNN